MSIRNLMVPVLLLACMGAVLPALAAPSLEGFNLGQPVAGPKVRPADLEGRVVLFVYWGQKSPGNVAAVPYLAKMQAQYPRQKLLMIVNDGENATEGPSAGDMWRKVKGGASVTLVKNGGLSDAALSQVDVDGRVFPLVFVFDAFGKYQYFDNPGPRLDAAVAAAFKASPGPAAVIKANAVEGKAKKLFGEKIPHELMPLAIQAAATGRPVAPALQALKNLAQSKKPLAEPAQAMADAIAQAITDKLDKGLECAKEEPATAWGLLEQLAQWAPGTPEAAKARKQMDEWKQDAAFGKELAADRVWLKLKAQAEQLGLGADPDAKPTKAVEESFVLLIQKHPGTHALKKAVERAEEWKIDAATGRADKSKPAAKEGPRDPGAADVLPEPDEPFQPKFDFK